MRISVPCNWQKSLLRKIDENPEVKKNVYDLFGTFGESFTGSGRPFFLFPILSRDKVQDYIDTVHDMGLKFTWLWNGECLGYFKFNEKEQSRALDELNWLDDMKVEYLTVADPYLAEFARTYSSIPLKVSVISEVNSVTRALDWQELIGTKGVITISLLINRNFPLLERIKKVVNCDLEILANDCCLQDCPFRFFHYTECSHSSQNYDPLNCYYNDWASIACMNQKCFNYEQILMCRWIQPSDTKKYMQLGYDYFKVSGRRYGTEWIFRALKAYSDQKFDGNLGLIYNAYSFVSDPLELASPQFSEISTRNEPMGSEDVSATMLSIPDFQGELVADELRTFIEKFPYMGAKCEEKCGVTCLYCFKYADKAFKPPPVKNEKAYRDILLYVHQYLNLGEGFVPAEEKVLKNPMKTPDLESFTGLPWDPVARDIFDKVMVIVPKSFQSAARDGIGFTAERTAERSGAEKVEKDLVIGVILKVVPTPFRHDAYDFLLEQEIDPRNFLTDEQIDDIKTLPYGTQEMADKARARGDIVAQSTPVQSAEVPSSPIVNPKTEVDWEEYLTSFMKAFNELGELKPQLENIAPLLFLYVITDKPEMSYWQFFKKDIVLWGMGTRDEPDVPTIIHKTNFETIKKVNSGESNPVQATMDSTYVIEGDMAKLMSCTPILPLNAKAHAKIPVGISKFDNILSRTDRVVNDLPWDEQSWTIFGKQIQEAVPAVFKELAYTIVGNAAEEKAKTEGVSEVGVKHAVQAFLDNTPEEFQTEMLQEMIKLGINLSDYGIDPTKVAAQLEGVSSVKWDEGLVELFNNFKLAVSEKFDDEFFEVVTETAEDLVTEDLKETTNPGPSGPVVITSAYIVEAVLSETGKEKKFALKKLKKLGFNVDSGKQRAKTRAEGIIWPDNVEDLFLRIISHSGRMVRGIAKRAVSKGSRKWAAKRHSKEISRMDVIRANLSETPGPFRKSMLNGLHIEGITDEEIKEAEQLNSST